MMPSIMKKAALLFVAFCASAALILFFSKKQETIPLVPNIDKPQSKQYFPFEMNENTKNILGKMFTEEELKKFGRVGPSINQIKAKAETIKNLDLYDFYFDIEFIPTDIAKSFKSLENLTLKIHFGFNSLKVLLNDIPNSKLKILTITGLGPGENFGEFLTPFESLTHLSISDGAILTSHKSIPSLFERLTFLELKNCELAELDFKNICKSAKNLETLNFEQNELSNLADSDLNDIQEILKTSLKKLNVSTTQLTSEGLRLLLNTFELETFDADYNDFSQSVSSNKIFGKHTKSLTFLSLIHCKLSDQIINEINENLINLETFYIYKSKIEDRNINESDFKQLQIKRPDIKIFFKNPLSTGTFTFKEF